MPFQIVSFHLFSRKVPSGTERLQLDHSEASLPGWIIPILVAFQRYTFKLPESLLQRKWILDLVKVNTFLLCSFSFLWEQVTSNFFYVLVNIAFATENFSMLVKWSCSRTVNIFRFWVNVKTSIVKTVDTLKIISCWNKKMC